MGHQFMNEWQQEARDGGMTLRLTSWRNSGWKRNPVQAASTFCLKITGNEARPDQEQLVQFLFDFATAASSLPIPESELPWREIIKWWDGQDLLLFCGGIKPTRSLAACPSAPIE